MIAQLTRRNIGILHHVRKANRAQRMRNTVVHRNRAVTLTHIVATLYITQTGPRSQRQNSRNQQSNKQANRPRPRTRTLLSVLSNQLLQLSRQGRLIRLNLQRHTLSHRRTMLQGTRSHRRNHAGLSSHRSGTNQLMRAGTQFATQDRSIRKSRIHGVIVRTDMVTHRPRTTVQQGSREVTSTTETAQRPTMRLLRVLIMVRTQNSLSSLSRGSNLGKLLSIRADLLLRHNRIRQSRLRQARRTHRLIHRQNLTVNHLQGHNRHVIRSATLQSHRNQSVSNLRQIIGRTHHLLNLR